jgi:hypothetical protein
MKKLLLALILLGAGLWAYLHFSAPAPRAEPDAVLRLSSFIEGQIDAVLGPLPIGANEGVASTSRTQELRRLREDIRDFETKATAGDRKQLATATQLCDSLLRASEERDEHLARLKDTRAKNKPSALADDPERDAAERLRFFENGIAHSWSETAKTLRATIDRQYAQLRALERK